MTKTIKLIIFDCDGTILNTYLLIQKVVYATFAKMFPNYQITKEEAQSFFGPYLKDSFKKYVSTEDEIKACVNCYQEIYNSLSKEYTKVYDGIVELLAFLKENDYHIAMVSNKASMAVKKGLEECSILSYFELIIGAEMMPFAKPHPGGIIMAEEYFKTEKAMMVGDTVIDIATGRNAGIKTTGVTWCVTDKASLQASGADYVIDHPSELIKILELENE